MSETIECPSCYGKGESFAFVNTGYDSSKHCSGMVKCLRCGGSGKVPAQMAEWVRAGNEFRNARFAEGLLMGDVAERLGVSTPTVSKAYHGYIDPAPLIAEWATLGAEGNGESGDAGGDVSALITYQR